MSWISKEEQEIMKEWAASEENEFFSKTYLSNPDEEKNSYWEMHDENEELTVYQFDTVTELQQILKKQFAEENMQDLILPLSIAAFKGKKKMDDAMEQEDDAYAKTDSSSDFTIPEFRYVF